MKSKWMAGPYPWLVSALAFLLPAVNYFVQADYTGGSIFMILSMMSLVNFFMRVFAPKGVPRKSKILQGAKK
jgi:hypothetical protein